MRNYLHTWIGIGLIGLLGLTSAYGQAALELRDVSIDGGNNVIYSGVPTVFGTSSVNPGSVFIPTGDSIQIWASVNGDTPTLVADDKFHVPLWPLSSGSTDTIKRVTNPNYIVNPARFGGGGGLVHDIIIWPTRINGSGSSITVPTTDTVRQKILFIDAAGFRITNNQVSGWNSLIDYETTYTILVAIRNDGIGSNTDPIECYVKLDQYPPVRILSTISTISANHQQSFLVANIRLRTLFNNIPLTEQFRLANHTLELYAIEQGLENSIESAHYSVNASNSFPVELLSFEGEVATNQIDLQWETATEQNNSHFILEKLDRESQHFAPIAWIDGMANSQAQRTYSFTDYYPSDGLNTYRLQQVDLDGSQNPLGEALELTFTSTGLESKVISFQEDPFSNEMTLRVQSLGGTGTLHIFDMMGRKVHSQEVTVASGVAAMPVHLGEMAPGTYIYRLELNEAQFSGKMLRP